MRWVDLLNSIDAFLWGKVLLILIIGLGLLLTWRLKGMQFRYLVYSLKLAFFHSDEESEGDVSHFQALMTALAATLGIGSIAGVATAIVAGGFGSIFWMWVIALLGMVTKYAEALLAIKYRITGENGTMSGGPMYYIERGLGRKGLGRAFAFFGVLAAFGGGNMTQSNSIASALNDLIHLPVGWCGALFALMTAAVVLGGIKSVGKVCAAMVPVMALLYLGGGIFVLASHWDKLGEACVCIVRSAFTGQAAVGGFLGAGVMAAVQMGAARGVASNEAGLGSAPIAAAAAKTDVPGRQAMISMSGVFLSSIIMCSITAFVIYVTGVLGSKGPDGQLLNGATLVMQAFRTVLSGSEIIVAIGLILFGYSTIVGWAYYGEKCVEYLAGNRFVRLFRLLFCGVVYGGAVMSLDLVWPFADIMNGLMAFPNLIALFLLSGVIVSESETFFALLTKEKALKLKSES